MHPPSSSSAAVADRPSGEYLLRRIWDHDLLAAGVLLWIVSLARALGALTRHEVFGAEGTLALCAAIAVPWLLVQAYLDLSRA